MAGCLALAPTYAQTANDEPEPRTYAREPENVAVRFERNNRPVPIHSGAWAITPEVEAGVGYDDNATTVVDAEVSSPFFWLGGSIRALNERGADYFQINASIRQTWYSDVSELDHFDAAAGFEFGIQSSDTIRWRAGFELRDRAEQDSANEGIITGGAFDPYVDLASGFSVPVWVGMTYDSGLWMTDLSAETFYAEWDDRHTRSGDVFDQSYRDGSTSNVRLRVGYHITEPTILFVEGRYNFQSYRDSTLDSDGWGLVAGLQFELTRLLTGEIYGGYASQAFDDADDVNGATYGCALNWYVTELVSARFEGRREFWAERTEIANIGPISSPVTRDELMLRIDYEPLRAGLLYGGARWAQNDYQDQNRTDETWRLFVGGQYSFTQNLRLTADYFHEASSSPVAGDAERNVVMAGLRYAF